MSQSIVPQVISPSHGVGVKLQNKVFRGIHNLSQYNACVGNNGNPNIYYYADGFSNAAFSLIDNVVDDYCSNPVDTFIYPICFNLRHSVELYLKALWEELCTLAYTKKKTIKQIRVDNKDANVLKVHDISIIWRGVKLNAINLDARFTPIIKCLDPFISCIHEVDPTGQTFRYSYDMETKEKHLVPVSLINIINLKKQFKEIIDYIEELKKLIDYLNYEYSMGTFTNKLNRDDIRNISLRLPPRSKWLDGDFDTIKKEIRAEYGIGSREFSSAVNYILKVHDFSTSVGIEHKPLGLSEDELLKFSDIWGVKNDINKWRDDLLRSLNYDKDNYDAFIAFNVLETTTERVARILNNSEKYKEAFDELFEYATPHNISGLTALFEYKGRLFSEEYVELYNSHLSYLKRCFDKGGDEWTSALDELWDDFLKNNHSLKRIIVALRRLNMTSYAHALEKHCMVEGLIP